jgi:hypothetical protein
MSLFGVFGNVNNPYGPLGLNVVNYTTSTTGGGLIVLVSNLVKLSIVVAGIYSLFNFIMAGYAYLSAGGDSKMIQKAVERIWRSVIGLTIVAGSILIGAIVGRLIFGPTYWNILISPRIFTP